MTSHQVTASHLRALATTDPASLFRDADTLIDSDEGIIRVPLRVVTAALDGNTKLTLCRLLYCRSQFADDGIQAGRKPRTFDGTDLDQRLEKIAEGLNNS